MSIRSRGKTGTRHAAVIARKIIFVPKNFAIPTQPVNNPGIGAEKDVSTIQFLDGSGVVSRKTLLPDEIPCLIQLQQPDPAASAQAAGNQITAIACCCNFLSAPDRRMVVIYFAPVNAAGLIERKDNQVVGDVCTDMGCAKCACGDVTGSIFFDI